MATPNSLKETYIEISSGSGSGTVSVSFIIQANPDNYPSELTTAGDFTANAPETADRAKVAAVITPVSALITSGNFRRLYASGVDGTKRKTRQVVIPSKSYEAVKALIEAEGGLDIGGLTCTSVSSGQRSTNR